MSFKEKLEAAGIKVANGYLASIGGVDSIVFWADEENKDPDIDTFLELLQVLDRKLVYYNKGMFFFYDNGLKVICYDK